MSREGTWPIFLLIWAGLLIGFFYLILNPGVEKLESLREEKQNLEAQVITLERKVRNLEQLEKRLTELRLAASLLEERLPEEKEISNLLLVIEDSALRSGVEVRSLVPQPLARKEDSHNQTLLSEVPFKVLLVIITGFSFSNYLRQSLFNSGKNFDLEEDKNGNLSIAVGLSTYVFSREGRMRSRDFCTPFGSKPALAF